MKINISGLDRDRLFQNLEGQEGLPVDKCCREFKIALPEEKGSGVISSHDFQHGLGLFIANVNLKEDWKWNFLSNPHAPLLFSFLVKGKVELELESEKGPRRQHPLETLIIAQPKGSSQAIHFRAGEEILFCCVRIKRKEFLEHLNCKEKDLPFKLAQIFTEDAVVESRSQLCNHSLAMAGFIQEVLKCNDSGVMKETFLEGKTRELLPLLLQCALEHDSSFETIALGEEDRKKIHLAREILVLDLQQAPTIEELAKRSGINRQKLKQGFKLVFKKTINQYLRDERLDKAKQMLLEGRHNVKDVADAVGYDNHSYFARLFKEKFGLLPGDFAKAARRTNAGSFDSNEMV